MKSYQKYGFHDPNGEFLNFCSSVPPQIHLVTVTLPFQEVKSTHMYISDQKGDQCLQTRGRWYPFDRLPRVSSSAYNTLKGREHGLR